MHASTVAQLLAYQSVPLINKEVYNQIYPRPSTSSSQNFMACKEIKNLPEPIFHEIMDYNISDMPHKPTNYIRYIERTDEEKDAEIEYDMDEDDVAWLERVNRKRQEKGQESITVQEFELLMDRIEKSSLFQLKASQNGNGSFDLDEADAICCVCTTGESEDHNNIVFCDMCNLAVHQECYGIPYLPMGQWLCRRCLHSPSQPVNCVLCPNNTGAFKQTDRNHWVHVVCAAWTPEVVFANPVFLEPICSIERIHTNRWNTVCRLCKQKGIGSSVNCSKKRCSVSFHVTCAQLAGFYMKIVGRPSDPQTSINRIIYCPTHIPGDIMSDPNLEAMKLKMIKTVENPVVSIPILPPEKIQEISEVVSFDKKNIFIPRLIAYWSLKRHLRNGVPLLRRPYILQQNDSSPSKETKAALTKRLRYWHRFRQHLEKARLLCELIRKRERLKREMLTIKSECIVYELSPLLPFLKKVLHLLCVFDTDDILQTSDTPEKAEVNTNRLDVSQIREKIEKFHYATSEEFEQDFKQLISAYLKNHPEQSKKYEAAIKLGDKCSEILIQAKDDLVLMEMGNYLPKDQEIFNLEENSDDSDIKEEVNTVQISPIAGSSTSWNTISEEVNKAKKKIVFADSQPGSSKQEVETENYRKIIDVYENISTEDEEIIYVPKYKKKSKIKGKSYLSSANTATTITTASSGGTPSSSSVLPPTKKSKVTKKSSKSSHRRQKKNSG